MPAPRDLDPSSSPLAFFGAELRRLRVAAGLTQEQLGARIAYSAAMVGAIETARRLPSSDFARAADEALGSDGLLSRLWGLVRRETYPLWFRPWVDIEQDAVSLRYWQPLVIPGLLQTEGYARAILSVGRPSCSPDEITEQVAARLARQRRLVDGSVTLWAIIDEQVLRRPVGGAKVMFDQLRHLFEAACRPEITIQVISSESGEHAGLDGGFVLASFTDGPGSAYLETAAGGQIITSGEIVRRLGDIYDRLRADALSPKASVALIEEAARSWTV